jgi:hypothetical protein
MQTHISYHLSKNIPGPKLKIDGVQQGFETIKKWCETHTIGTYSGISLHLTVNENDPMDLGFLNDEFLLQPLSSFISGAEGTYHVLEWNVVISRLPTLFQFIHERLAFFEKYEFRISVSIDCILLNESGNVLKGQNLYAENQHSRFLFFIHNNITSVEPTIYLPFDKDDEAFQSFFLYLKSHFPFKLNDKNLNMAIKNEKSKYGYTWRKLRK